MRLKSAVFCGALGATAFALANLQSLSLAINGKVASSRVRMIGGEAWVPVRDVAAAEGLTVQKIGSRLQLIAAGGANQVDGLRAKLGDSVFDGTWRLTVHSFNKVASYPILNKTSTDYSVYNGVADLQNNTFTAKPGFTLYVADCTLKNGTQGDAQYEWSTADNKTSVVDSAGSNHPWVVFDIPSPAFVSRPIVPGGAVNFNICFAVADSAKPQGLIVTLKSLTQKKGHDARILLPSDQ